MGVEVPRVRIRVTVPRVALWFHHRQVGVVIPKVIIGKWVLLFHISINNVM